MTPTAIPSPFGRRYGSEILFQSARDGDFELYVMSADASNVTKLTSNNDFDGNARWSPDGTQIV